MFDDDEQEDLSKMDRGDNVAPEEEVEAPEAPEAEAPEESSEEAVSESEDDQPRDEQGRFAKKETQMVPKARFDEALIKERSAREAAEARLREIEAQQAQIRRSDDARALEAEINELEKQHSRLLIDGESDKAAEVMAQIRRMERQINIAEAQNMSATAKEQAREEIRMELTVEKLEAEYPALNPDSETYDDTLVEFVLAKQQALMQKERMGASAALARAATEVMARFGASPAQVPEKGLKQPVEDRKGQQVKKNLEAAKRQPPNLKDTGVDSDKLGEKALPDITNMSYDEFDALPESTKAKLRGDFV